MANTTAQNKLIAATGKVAAPPAHSPPDYLRRLVRMRDRDLAAKLVVTYAGLEFDSKEGKDLPRFEAEKAELDIYFDSASKHKQKLDGRLYGTEPEINRPNDEQRKFSSWRLKDQFAIVLLVSMLLAVMVMGAANTYANLMASGEPVFLDQPWLAVTLSALVPAGSTALKFISHFFEHGNVKKRYALGIYVLTFIAILAWSITFSLNFTGVTGGIDWEAIGKSDGGKGALFVFLQMVCEILVAGSLYLAIEQVTLIYDPPKRDHNPEYIGAQRALEQHEPHLGKLREQRNQANVDLAVLKCTREEHILRRQGEFLDLVAIHNF